MQGDARDGRIAARPGPNFPSPGTIRRVLLLGFCLVFALWLGSGYDLWRRLDEVQARTAVVNARYSTAEQLVGTIRAQMLLGSLYLRDLLLDIPSTGTAGYHDELRDCRENVARALDEYRPVLDSAEERAMFANLEREVASFWDTVLPILEWTPSRRNTEARELLRRLVIPKRETIIRVSRSLQALNRTAFAERQIEVAGIYADMQRRVAVFSGLALFVSLVVAALVLASTGRLERRIRVQQLRDAQNTRDLQRLSARLADAQEKERRAIARELHDEVGQALTAIKMELSVAERSPAGEGQSAGRLDAAHRITDRALHTVRDLSRLLHPPVLDDLGLATAIDYDLRTFSRRTGVPAEFVQEGLNRRFAPEIEIAAYRIVQEALTNVARHAAASRCRVALCHAAGQLRLTVDDDGKGFDPAATAAGPTGLGLLGIRERVAGLGGTTDLRSSPGKGTCLAVVFPSGAPPDGEPAGEQGKVAMGVPRSEPAQAR